MKLNSYHTQAHLKCVIRTHKPICAITHVLSVQIPTEYLINMLFSPVKA